MDGGRGNTPHGLHHEGLIHPTFRRPPAGGLLVRQTDLPGEMEIPRTGWSATTWQWAHLLPRLGVIVQSELTCPECEHMPLALNDLTSNVSPWTHILTLQA